MIRCRRCKSPVPPSFSFPGACHVAPAPRGLWVTRLRLHAARQTSTEDYSGGNKQTRLSQSLSGTHRQQRGASNEATDGTGLCTDTQTHTCTWTALNPLQFPSWSSRGILDCVKDIMGQIEMMWWEGCVSTCVYVCGWLIDEMLSLRRVSVMMTITRGGELRQLWLLGIQIGVLTGLLLKFVFFLRIFLSLDGQCQGAIVTVFFCTFLLDRQQVCCFYTSWSLAAQVSCRHFKTPGGDLLRRQQCRFIRKA